MQGIQTAHGMAHQRKSLEFQRFGEGAEIRNLGLAGIIAIGGPVATPMPPLVGHDAAKTLRQMTTDGCPMGSVVGPPVQNHEGPARRIAPLHHVEHQPRRNFQAVLPLSRLIQSAAPARFSKSFRLAPTLDLSQFQ